MVPRRWCRTHKYAPIGKQQSELRSAGRYFDPGSAWNPRPISRAGSRIVASVTSVVTPLSTSVVNTQSVPPRPSRLGAASASLARPEPGSRWLVRQECDS